MTSTSNDSVDISTEECPNIRYLEHVEVEITFSYTGYRGVTQLDLISPAGTKSNLLHYRPEDADENKNAGNHTWTYMSVHFWGESAIGSWVLQIRSNNSSVTGTKISKNSFRAKLHILQTKCREIYTVDRDFVLILNCSIINIRIV